MIEFTCSNFTFWSNPCLNAQASCKVANLNDISRASTDNRSYEYCECPLGFLPDNMVFHEPNCVLPDQYYLGFFILMSSLAFIFLLSIFVEFRKGRNKHNNNKVRFVLLASISTFLQWLHALAIYLQNGNFQAANSMYMLAVVSICLWGCELTKVVMQPSFAVARKSFNTVQRGINLFFAVVAVFISVGLVACIFLSADSNPNSFNLVVLYIMISSVMFVNIGVMLLRSTIQNLCNHINISLQTTTSNNTGASHYVVEGRIELVHLLSRLKYMKQQMLLLVFNQITMGAYIVIKIVTGSAPYYFILASLIYLSTICLVPISVWTMLRRKAKGNSDSNKVNGSQSAMVVKD